MTIKTLGIDIAKECYQLHGADRSGKIVSKKRLSKANLLVCLANLSPYIS